MSNPRTPPRSDTSERTPGGLENPAPAPTGIDHEKGSREEPRRRGHSLGDRRMFERAFGGEGGGQPSGTGDARGRGED